MRENVSDEMKALAEALDNAALAYRNIAQEELKPYGSIDTIYNCVRNERNLRNKSRKVIQFNSTY